jgi:hypothetical protein
LKMAAVTKALNDRALREAYLGTTQKELVGYCSVDTPNIRRVNKLLNSLNTVWRDLMNAQVTYCGAKGIEMGSEESQKYLDIQQKIYFAGKGAAEDILEQEEEEPDEEAEKKARGLSTKREIAVLQLEVEEDIKCLTTVLGSTTISGDGYKEAWEMLRNVEHKLKVEHKTLVGNLGENLEQTEAEGEKVKAVKFVGEKTSL